MKILADLYYGRVIPHEHGIKSGNEYEELLGCVIGHEDDLVPILTEQQKETFEKYKDCKPDIDGINELEAIYQWLQTCNKNYDGSGAVRRINSCCIIQLRLGRTLGPTSTYSLKLHWCYQRIGRFFYTECICHQPRNSKSVSYL